MKNINEINVTINRKVYNRLYKKYICKKLRKCVYCRWHRGENAATNAHRLKKSWKKYRDRLSQYSNKSS